MGTPHNVEPRELEPGIFSFKRVAGRLRKSDALEEWLRRIGIPGALPDYLDVLRRFEVYDGIEEAWRPICKLVQKRWGRAQDLRDVCVFVLVGLLQTTFDVRAVDIAKVIKVRDKREHQTEFVKLKQRLARAERSAKSLAELQRIRERGDLEIEQLLLLTPAKIDVVSRKDQDGSRTRKLFYWRLGEGIRRATGKPCYEQARMFAEAAFPDRGDISLDEVRGAWRPTTKKTRSRNGTFVSKKRKRMHPRS